jgi:four helix bundle protein
MMVVFLAHSKEQSRDLFLMKDSERTFNLEERLIKFASSVIKLAELLPATFAGRHLAGQMIRSGTAPALHYGEAQAAESRKDFIHKMKIALKELRETFNALRIVQIAKWLSAERLDPLLDENNQLISIFVTSLATATKAKEAREATKNDECGTHK